MPGTIIIVAARIINRLGGFRIRKTRLGTPRSSWGGADGGVPQTCKPGSVFFLGRKNGDHLSSLSACNEADGNPLLAERRYRRGQAANPGTGRAPMSPYSALLQVGVSRRCVTADGRTLLPSDFTLILPFLEGRYVSVPLSVPDDVGTWALPSTLPRGARTFLPPSFSGRTAVTRSALPSSPDSSIAPYWGQTSRVWGAAQKRKWPVRSGHSLCSIQIWGLGA